MAVFFDRETLRLQNDQDRCRGPLNVVLLVVLHLGCSAVRDMVASQCAAQSQRRSIFRCRAFGFPATERSSMRLSTLPQALARIRPWSCCMAFPAKTRVSISRVSPRRMGCLYFDYRGFLGFKPATSPSPTPSRIRLRRRLSALTQHGQITAAYSVAHRSHRT